MVGGTYCFVDERLFSAAELWKEYAPMVVPDMAASVFDAMI